MALIKCIECSREISDKAAACPHCGCPAPAPEPATPDKVMCPSCGAQYPFNEPFCPCGMMNSQRYESLNKSKENTKTPDIDKPKTSNSIGCGGIILTFIVIGIISSLFSNSNSPSSTPYSPALPSQSDTKRQAINQMQLNKFNWNTGVSDSIMFINATIVNNGDKNVKDITITCEHYSNSGTKIDSNSRVVYETVMAHKSKRIKEFNMGFIHSQAKGTDCKITDLEFQ